jgi:hypothetical protein
VFLYIISQEGSTFYKIGISNNPARRLENLQSGNPYKLSIYRSYNISNKKVEAVVHRLLRKFHVRLEWFDIPNLDILNIVDKAVAVYA